MSWSVIGPLMMAFVATCLAQRADASQSDSRKNAIKRLEAEIYQRIKDEGLPSKTFITQGTQSVGHASYYKDVQRRVEKIGTRDFPQKDGKKLYGDMVVSISIYQDGRLYMRDGGARIEKSSGNADLDEAALAIVRRAAPFGRFPPKLLSAAKDDVWVIITRFSFARVNALEAPVEETRPSGANSVR
jgi:protein TonB